MIAAPLVLLGQLLGTAFASGINLYAAVAVLGVGSRLGLIPELPVGLRGLESSVVIGSALVLYLVEAVADKVPALESAWDAVHTLIRPPAAAFLAAAALSGAPASVQLAGGALAGATALAAHGTKAGLRITLLAARRRVPSATVSLGEDILAVGLVLAVLRYPGAAIALTACLALVSALIGPRLWRAFALGFRGLAAQIRRFFRAGRWYEPDELPADLRSLLDRGPGDPAASRAVRAGVVGLAGPGAFRNGWLVLSSSRAFFLFRRWLRPCSVPFAPPGRITVRAGQLADVLTWQDVGSSTSLLLLKDGPPADLVAADLERIGPGTPPPQRGNPIR